MCHSFTCTSWQRAHEVGFEPSTNHGAISSEGHGHVVGRGVERVQSAVAHFPQISRINRWPIVDLNIVT